MYHEFYNLRSLPFENTPDPRVFFASDQHREALAAIEYTIRMRKGYVLITGDIGSGKTTVGRTMCERCGPHATIVQVMHSHGDSDALLRQILRAMNVRFHNSDDHGRLLERLKHELYSQAAAQRPVVVLVDEAQTFSDAALEELRLLSNFDTPTQKLVQVVLVGQPELRQRILLPRFDALRQRIVVAKQLLPMSLDDTRAYIAHRLAAVSNDPKNVQPQFTEDAIAEVHRISGGIPRIINVACDNCLLLGFVRQSRQVTVAMVQRVEADMLPSLREPSIIINPQATANMVGSA